MKTQTTTRSFSKTLILGIATLSMGLTSAVSQAADLDAVMAKAIDSPARTDADKARDANRKPAETLKFFQLEPNMKVLELVPGGGWYTKILAPILKDEGKLYLAVGTTRIEGGLLKEPGFEKVSVVKVDSDLARNGGPSDGTYMKFDVKDLDMVLTFRNLHNFAAGGRNAINKAAFDSLKPGGLYGVIDHTRRHNEPQNSENGRRMDPVLAIKEIESVGFEFVDYSDLHYRASDKLELELRKEGVAGKTDRFTFLFRKPE